MSDGSDPTVSSASIDLRGSMGVIIGPHGTQVNSSGRARESPPVSIAPPLPLHIRDKDRRLRGRDELVEELVALLKDSGNQLSGPAGPPHADEASMPQRVRLLYGPGGCGKTSIAEQVAYEA